MFLSWVCFSALTSFGIQAQVALSNDSDDIFLLRQTPSFCNCIPWFLSQASCSTSHRHQPVSRGGTKISFNHFSTFKCSKDLDTVLDSGFVLSILPHKEMEGFSSMMCEACTPRLTRTTFCPSHKWRRLRQRERERQDDRGLGEGRDSKKTLSKAARRRVSFVRVRE